MSVILAAYSKDHFVDISALIINYLSLFPSIFKKEERDEFIFRNQVAGVGVLFEGQVPESSSEDFVSQTTRITGKDFGIQKYRLMDSPESIDNISRQISEQDFGNSRFVIIEHTANWYEDPDWLKHDLPPRVTPGGNIYFPYGSIGPFFGKEPDTKGKRYSDMVSSYYGQFLDSQKLSGLAEITQLRHFTAGIYSKSGAAKLFFVRSKSIVSDIDIFRSEDQMYICTAMTLTMALVNKLSIKTGLEPIQSGDIIEIQL